MMSTEAKEKYGGFTPTKSKTENEFTQVGDFDIERIADKLKSGKLSKNEILQLTHMLQHPDLASSIQTTSLFDSRRPTYVEDPYSETNFTNSLADSLANNPAFCSSVRDWAAASGLGGDDEARVIDSAIIVGKVISRLLKRSHRVHLLQGAVQLGKTSVCILLSMALSKIHDLPTIVVYLSDSQNGNHKQNLADWKQISQHHRSRTSMVVISSMDNDHTPNRTEYNQRVYRDTAYHLESDSPPELLLLSTKKNRDNMEGLKSVISQLYDDYPEAFKMLIINDEADAQTVAPCHTNPNAAYTQLEELAEMADHVVHVTATPQAVLAIPHHHLLAPCTVSVMKRPLTYISPHSMWLQPAKLKNHVLNWKTSGVPFNQARVASDLTLLQEYDSFARKKLKELLIVHSVKAYLMSVDPRVDLADCAALLQLTRFVDVQNRIVELLKEVKYELLEIWSKEEEDEERIGLVIFIDEIVARLMVTSGLNPTSMKADFGEVIQKLVHCEIRSHNGDFPEPIRSRNALQDPINAIYVALDMLQRARRVDGLVTVAIWHMGNRPSVDLLRQRDRMSGHRAYCLPYITWHLPSEIIQTLYGIAMAQERQRKWLEEADEKEIDLRSVDVQLYYPPGGAPTTRADGLESNENHSLLSGGRYDRTFWKPMHLKSLVNEVESLIQTAIEMELSVTPHIKGDGNRLQIRGCGRDIIKLLRDTIGRPQLGLAPRSVFKVIEIIESTPHLYDLDTTLTIQLTGNGKPFFVEGMKKCRVAKRTLSDERNNEIRGSLGGGSGEKVVKDWDLDWKPVHDEKEALRWGSKRSPEMGTHLLLTALSLNSDDVIKNNTEQVHFGFGAELPIGLWTDSEYSVFRAGGFYND